MDTGILFEFPDRRSAFYAFDTLEELGYNPVIEPDSQPPKVHIHLHRCDVTSALEIAQACGGHLVERTPAQETAVYREAYSLQDDIHAEGRRFRPAPMANTGAADVEIADAEMADAEHAGEAKTGDVSADVGTADEETDNGLVDEIRGDAFSADVRV